MAFNDKKLKRIMEVVSVIITILLVLFIFYGLKVGFFESRDVLTEKIKHFGVFGPIFFLILQIIQVIFPVIPGGASCLAGVIAFGPVYGFIYNYIGLCVGSVIAFFISRNFGLPFIRKLFCKRNINKYLGYIQNRGFDTVFFFGILLPGAPDDLLCYIAGVSGISNFKFIVTILLGKPLTLIFYSCFMRYFLL